MQNEFDISSFNLYAKVYDFPRKKLPKKKRIIKKWQKKYLKWEKVYMGVQIVGYNESGNNGL